jgi:hypothetical protein
LSIKKHWACLPAGPLERQLWGGEPGRFKVRDPYRIFKKEWIPFVEERISGLPLLVIDRTQRNEKGCPKGVDPVAIDC